MNRRNFILVILILLFAALGRASAQTGEVKVVAVMEKLQMLPSQLPKAEVVDTTQIVALYRYNYPVDNFKGDFDEAEDVLEVQVGRNTCKTFSRNLYLMDRNRTYRESNPVKFRFDYTDYELFRDNTDKCVTVQHRIPNSVLLQGSTQVVEYTEPIPVIKWTTTEHLDSIAGYPCVRAEGRLGGRDWIVWFTPQIPLSYGPWKLGGLPGLILKAEDPSGDYKFEIQSISKVSEPIVRYDWHPVKMSKTKWMQTERKMYEHPKDYFSQNGEIQVLSKDRKPLEKEWKIRYNPLEQE